MTIRNTAIAKGVQHVVASVPEALAALGVTPEHVRNMVEARFGGLLAADPNSLDRRIADRLNHRNNLETIIMRRNLALPLLVGLSACSNLTPEQHAKIRQVLTVACNVDGVVVPVAQPIVATLGQAGATAADVDLLVHPAVVEACKASAACR